MDFEWPDDLRQFIEDVMTPELAAEIRTIFHGEGGGPLIKAVQSEVDRRGWLKKSWPVEHGGEGASPWYRYILAFELRYAGIPFSQGSANMIAPSIARFGTEEQQRTLVPKIWSGEITCALGYSEPDAGTDLASLKTRAVRDGDEYVISGQKIWTSGAHRCSHVWLAARTDPEAPKHRGISMFVLPLDLPGITIRPIWTSAGVRTNEVFYEDVRVPAESLIGEENRGWYIIANALDHERVTVGIDDHIDLIQVYDQLVQFLREDQMGRIDRDATRRNLAQIRIDLLAHRALLLNNAAIVAQGGTPTKEASMVKIWGTELRHRLADVGTDLLGRYGALRAESGEMAPLRGRLEATYRYAPVVRFAGGTNEVQRNIIAQRGLGLPR